MEKQIQYLNQNNSKSFSKKNYKKIPISNSKNLKYFPITTNDQGYNTIYLVAEDSHNEVFNNNNQRNIKNERNSKNNKITSQRSIELEIQKNKSRNFYNKFADKENRKIERNKTFYNFSNINTQFNLNNKKIDITENNPQKKLTHSFSVDNYSNINNDALKILGANLKSLENSTIMKENFINAIKDSKRKKNLLNALNIYKNYKSFNKIDDYNNINNSYTLNTKNGGNKMNKFFKNDYNIIIEDENENSENDTINNKNKKYIDKNKNDLGMVNNNKTNAHKKYPNSKEIINIQIPKREKKLFYTKIYNKSRDDIKSDKYKINIENNGINENETKKYIKKSIQKEIKKIYNKNNNNNISHNKNLNININNNINNSININNNKNINNNNQNNQRKIFLRNITEKQKYIINEKNKEKLFENSKTKINNNLYYNNNNIAKNEYMNQLQIKQYELPIKERYHRQKPKILTLNENNVKHVISGYNRNNISQTNNNSFIKSRTTCNSIKKIKPDIINNYSYKNSDYKKNNNIYKNPSLHSNYLNMNNNIANNNFYLESQTTKNNINTDYQISLINNNDNYKNHFYHEIKQIKGKKNKKVSKTIYHDYTDFSGSDNFYENKFNNTKIITRNNSSNHLYLQDNPLNNHSQRNLKQMKYQKEININNEMNFNNNNNITNYGNIGNNISRNNKYNNYWKYNKTEQNSIHFYH